MAEENSWYGKGWATFKGAPVFPPENDDAAQTEWLNGACACWCEYPEYCETDENGYYNPDTETAFQDELKRILSQSEKSHLLAKLLKLYEK